MYDSVCFSCILYSGILHNVEVGIYIDYYCMYCHFYQTQNEEE